MIQTVRTIEKLTDVSFLNETHSGSRCYRVHDPILAFAKTVLLSRDRPVAADEEGSPHGAATAATRTRKVAVALQARYLSRVNTLLRFSGGGGGSSVVEAEAARRCGDMVLLGGLPALAALWQSLEDLRPEGGRGRDQQEEANQMAATPPLLENAYGDALEGMGSCVEAASGYWAAAKLLQVLIRSEQDVRTR